MLRFLKTKKEVKTKVFTQTQKLNLVRISLKKHGKFSAELHLERSFH